ncbi:MAG: hypothetical protein U1E67_12940 [Hyphomicrobiales bacterium]
MSNARAPRRWQSGRSAVGTKDGQIATHNLRGWYFDAIDEDVLEAFGTDP